MLHSLRCFKDDVIYFLSFLQRCYFDLTSRTLEEKQTRQAKPAQFTAACEASTRHDAIPEEARRPHVFQRAARSESQGSLPSVQFQCQVVGRSNFDDGLFK
jgi:hypothetical protein